MFPLFFLMPVVLPSLVVTGLYILAAVVPAAVLLRYIYDHDTVEPEPPGLLWSLVFFGVLAALLSGILEGIGESILSSFVSVRSPYYTILFAFLVVAAVEEGTKYFFLKRRTWRDPAFNYRFDGVVYSVFVSLGFAAFENIQYVFSYGLSVALPRAVLSIPGHTAFAVFMGLHYGRAKLCEARGDLAAAQANRTRGVLTAVFLHGFYDAAAMSESGLSTVLFIVFVGLMFHAAFRALKRESQTDEPIYSGGWPFW